MTTINNPVRNNFLFPAPCSGKISGEGEEEEIGIPEGEVPEVGIPEGEVPEDIKNLEKKQLPDLDDKIKQLSQSSLKPSLELPSSEQKNTSEIQGGDPVEKASKKFPKFKVTLQGEWKDEEIEKFTKPYKALGVFEREVGVVKEGVERALSIRLYATPSDTAGTLLDKHWEKGAVQVSGSSSSSSSSSSIGRTALKV